MAHIALNQRPACWDRHELVKELGLKELVMKELGQALHSFLLAKFRGRKQ
jgi:hypothetical protein